MDHFPTMCVFQIQYSKMIQSHIGEMHDLTIQSFKSLFDLLGLNAVINARKYNEMIPFASRDSNFL